MDMTIRRNYIFRMRHNYERAQLQSYLSRKLSVRPLETFIDGSFADLLAAKSPPLPKLRDQLRAFHDRLGYCAKGKLASGGLCAGTIYRTSEFTQIRQEKRVGSKRLLGVVGDARTIHVEHTVPVRALAIQISKLDPAERRNRQFMLAWLLRHSVTTALAKGQERFKTGFTSSTFAFDASAEQAFNRPFARYFYLRNGPPETWNVWTGELIKPAEFTFDHHLETMMDLLRHCGAPADMLESIMHHTAGMSGVPGK